MTAASPIIHIVDDDSLFRTAIARLMKVSGYRVAQYESADQFLMEANDNEPGCVLLDIQMTGLNGLDLQDRLQKLGTILPIVFLTGHGDIPTSVRAIKAGAEDMLSKPVAKDILLNAVSRALTRYHEQRERHDRLRSMHERVGSLTSRESEVFFLVVRGKLNKQIAHELGISERTVKAHRKSIMQKLDVRSVAGAVSIAEKLGMLAASPRTKGQ